MKKIALLADGWRRYVIYSWVEGIMGGSKELGLDVCLYFYNTNGTWSQDSKFNKGEYALNDLPDLNSFDGVYLTAPIRPTWMRYSIWSESFSR